MDEAGSPLELSLPNVLGAPTPKRTPQTQTLLPFKNPSCSWVPPRTLNNLESGKEQKGKTDPSGGSCRGAPGLEDRHNCRFYPQTNRSPWSDKPSSDGPRKTHRRGARSLPAARLAAGRRRPLQYHRREAAPPSPKEAAMLPPPRLRAVTSAASHTACGLRVCAAGLAGSTQRTTRARAFAALGGLRPTRGGARCREAWPERRNGPIRNPRSSDALPCGPLQQSLPPRGRRTLVYPKPSGVLEAVAVTTASSEYLPWGTASS